VRAYVIMDKLLFENPKMQDRFIKEDVASKLVGHLCHSSQLVKQHAAYIIWAISNTNELGQKAIFYANGIPNLIRLLNRSDCSSMLKEYIAGAICALCENESNNKKALLDVNGFDSLNVLLSSGVDSVASAAAKAIWSSTDGNSSNQTAAKWAIKPLSDLLYSKALSVQSSAASALWSLCKQNVVNQQFILKHGAVERLIDIVSEHTDEYLQYPKEYMDLGQLLLAVVGTLNSITSKNLEIKDSCTSLGGVEALEPLLQVTDRHLLKEVTGTLNNLGKVVRSGSRSPKGGSRIAALNVSE